MKIPPNAVIAEEKLTQYLLVPRQRNDKSRFLSQAGFSVEEPVILEQAIRKLTTENDAVGDREDEYGVFYQVVGSLEGPKGILSVITIWIKEAGGGQYRFVTLKPAKG